MRFPKEDLFMDISNIISLMGGLGAFLFGMKYMGDGLELAAGSSMKNLLEKLTRNRFLGFLLGTLVTVVIQSSSATTVMVMGFINAGIMDLAQATGVIFGANIGTTITSILIALDVSPIAPFCICVGAFLMLYSKKKQYRYVGQVILGFGLLFQGLHTMSGSMKPLKDVLWFQEFIMNARNPIVGLLVGALICAVIQSSSAAVGILQALAMQGMMPLYFASFLVCGINIGSAMPTIISSLNARNNAKRAACIYLLYNVVGAVIMTLVTLITPYTDWVAQLIPNPAFQVSFVHIAFKVVAAVVLLPCTELIVKLTYKIIPKQTHENANRLEYIDENLVGNPSVTMLQIRRELQRMASLVRENVGLAMGGVLAGSLENKQKILDNEATIDYLTEAITAFLVKLNVMELNASESAYVTGVYQVLNDLERIGDYAENLILLAEQSKDKNLGYSEEAQAELTEIYSNVRKLYDDSVACFYRMECDDVEMAAIGGTLREINLEANQSQHNHMKRMRSGICTAEQGIIFGEVLNALSRIAGHSINVAEAAAVES